MTEEEYSRYLQDYIFEKVSSSDKQHLAREALQSMERGLEFGQAEEIRQALEDQGFRRELLSQLNVVALVEREPSWRLRWDPFWLIPFACGAALIMFFLMVRDYQSREENSVEQITSVRTPEKPRKKPALAPKQQPSRRQDSNQPAAIQDSSARAMANLFDVNPVESVRLNLTLSRKAEFESTDEVTASLLLPETGHVYAFVKGPDGAMREVYPPSSSNDSSLKQGPASFSFPATLRVDPLSGGRFRLRVFIVNGSEPLPFGQVGWQMLRESGHFEEAEYEVRSQ